jgi:protein-tyrosine phosphatase
MSGYTDLHCHWLPRIDDGVKTEEDGAALLTGLKSLGFETVVATPHMRPPMYDNSAEQMNQSYQAMVDWLTHLPSTTLPQTALGSEHYFTDGVFARLLAGKGMPYPGNHCVLIEVNPETMPVRLGNSFFELRRKAKLRPILAHPERYRFVWEDSSVLDQLLDGGCLLLLDVAALAGKYGKEPERCANHLLEEGYYYAACSDAHRPSDLDKVALGIERLQKVMGAEETNFLLGEGPRNILRNQIED